MPIAINPAMPLIIKAVKYQDAPIRDNLSFSSDRQQFSLGRSPQNHLALPDPENYVSRRHAVIDYEAGNYYLTDTSTAGTFFTNRNALVQNKKVQLCDGDQLRIGDYDLVVSISEDVAQKDSGLEGLFPSSQEFARPSQGPAFVDSMVPPLAAPSGPLTPQGAVSRPPEIPTGFDFCDLLRDEEGEEEHGPSDFPEIPPPAEADRQGAEAASEITQGKKHIPRPGEKKPVKEQAGIVRAQVSPPPMPAPPQEIMERPGPQAGPGPGGIGQVGPAAEMGREPLAAAESAAHVSKPPSRELFDLFLEAAGISDRTMFPDEKIPEFMRTVGAVFREMTRGLMAILRGRMEMKNLYRVERTILASADNNPLKFSPNLEDALTLMLLKNRPGFIDAVEAIRQGFADIMNHQLATNAGIQAALAELLDRFDPQHFAKKFAEGLVFQKKAKCWDAFCEAYPELVKNAPDNFLGDEFARAYEEQMAKLRVASRELKNPKLVTRNS